MLGVYQIVPYPELPEIDKQKLNKANDKLSWFSSIIYHGTFKCQLTDIYTCTHGVTTQKGRHTIAWKSFISKLATLNRLPRIMASFLGENSSRFKVTDALTREFPTCNETPFL